jgi:hypothetical protein
MLKACRRIIEEANFKRFSTKSFSDKLKLIPIDLLQDKVQNF